MALSQLKIKNPKKGSKRKRMTTSYKMFHKKELTPSHTSPLPNSQKRYSIDSSLAPRSPSDVPTTPQSFIDDNDTDSTRTRSPSSLADNNDTKTCFPAICQHSGFLDVRTRTKGPWKRRYFVVNNNFLLSAATPHALKLEQMICLEGSKLSKHLKSSDMTFELFIRKRKIYFRTASPSQCQTWTKAISQASKLKIKDLYRFLYQLGEGQANVKVVAAKHKTTNEDVAIKIVDKRQCNRKMLNTEIRILKDIDNPYIVRIFDLIETKKYLYLVMEMCEGGELFDQIAELDGDAFSERDTCQVMHQICHAVKYMNERGIVHRDLKPENILCTKKNSVKNIKVCDFGISKMMKTKDNLMAKSMSTLCGTVSYTAPEVLKRKTYDYTVDYWSIGVIMFILLCGYPPYYGESDGEIEYNIIHTNVEFDDEDWTHISYETKQLVKGLLHKDPKQRLCPDDVLKLTWKVNAKTASFKKSRQRFRATVTKNKIQRLSMYKSVPQMKEFSSVKFDEESKESIVIGLNDSHSNNKSNNNKFRKSLNQKLYLERHRAKDDMDMASDFLHSVQKKERIHAAFNGHRKSKATEALLELNMDKLLPTIDDDEDEDEYSLL